MKKLIIAILTAAMVVTTGVCAFPSHAENTDPSASYVPVAAPYEDSGIDLWFDYASRKVPGGAAVSTGMDTFSVYMAKNEIEDAQFFLSSADGRTDLDAEVSQFSNDSGDMIDTELFIEYYHDCGDSGSIPDAIPPLSAYGSFDLEAGAAQGFIIKLTTATDTPSGWYSATLTVKDSAGKAVKTATVFAYVWDYALSEETRLATSVNLSYDYLTRVCSTESITGTELYKNYYDYLLENRVCAYFLPYALQSASARAYMDNPRVTSYQYGTVAGGSLNDAVLTNLFNTVFAGEENAHRFDKAYYFSNVVDASTPADLEALRSAYQSFYNKVGALKPSYSDVPFWFISTYINDIDYTAENGTLIDQIDYYGDFVNLWCAKTFAYTDQSELSVPGSKLLQNTKWDSVYGTFKSRMAEKTAAGQKVWSFISWDVEAPYINYYMQTEGAAQRVLFWQQYDNGVSGFLYNFANFWMGDCADPYANNVTNSAYPDAHGESILIYPGDVYGLNTPVGSLRLEAMRDGIEDYQMFSMLDETAGSGTSDSYIDVMTTGAVTYSTSDADYYAARVSAGNALEAAINEPAPCQHSYSSEITVNATCTADGEMTYTCTNCGDSYTEVIPAAGHSFVNGVCTVCGAPDPAFAYLTGDINNDGSVTPKDANLMLQIISGKKDPTALELASADIFADGTINAKDSNKLIQYLTGKISSFD